MKYFGYDLLKARDLRDPMEAWARDVKANYGQLNLSDPPGAPPKPDVRTLEEEFSATAYGYWRSEDAYFCSTGTPDAELIGLCFESYKLVENVLVTRKFDNDPSSVWKDDRIAFETYKAEVDNWWLAVENDEANYAGYVVSTGTRFAVYLPDAQNLAYYWRDPHEIKGWGYRGEGRSARRAGANQDRQKQKFFGPSFEKVHDEAYGMFDVCSRLAGIEAGTVLPTEPPAEPNVTERLSEWFFTGWTIYQTFDGVGNVTDEQAFTVPPGEHWMPIAALYCQVLDAQGRIDSGLDYNPSPSHYAYGSHAVNNRSAHELYMAAVDQREGEVFQRGLVLRNLVQECFNLARKFLGHWEKFDPEFAKRRKWQFSDGRNR